MLGCNDEKEVFLKMKTTEFYKLLNYYYSYYFNWKYVYKRYKLIFNHNIIRSEIPLVEKELQRELVNCNVVNALNSSAEQNYNDREKHGFKLPMMYLKAQTLLTDTLIKVVEGDPYDTGEEVLQSKAEEVDEKLILSEEEQNQIDTELDAIFGL